MVDILNKDDGNKKSGDDVEIMNLKVLIEEELQLSRNDEGEMNAEQEDGAKKIDPTTNLKVTDNSRPNKDSMENSQTWTQILDPVTCDKLEKSVFLEIDEGKRKFSLEKQVFEQENCVIRNIESELQLEDERYISPKTVVAGNMKTRAQIEKHAKLSNIIQKLKKIEKENQSIQEEKKDSKGKKVSRKRIVGNGLGTRISKPSHFNKSPYVKRPMSINKQLTVLETNVSENIFTSSRDEYEIIFETNHGIQMQRVVFESLYPAIKVHSYVIDAWAHLMNFEEERWDPDRNGRLQHRGNE